MEEEEWAQAVEAFRRAGNMIIELLRRDEDDVQGIEEIYEMKKSRYWEQALRYHHVNYEWDARLKYHRWIHYDWKIVLRWINESIVLFKFEKGRVRAMLDWWPIQGAHWRAALKRLEYFIFRM